MLHTRIPTLSNKSAQLSAHCKNALQPLFEKGFAPGIAGGVVTVDGSYGVYAHGLRTVTGRLPQQQRSSSSSSSQPTNCDSNSSNSNNSSSENNNAITEYDRFHLGSIGKSITSTVIHSLIEQQYPIGRETCLSQYWPDCPSQGVGAMKLQDLLDHRSRLNDATHVYGFSGFWGFLKVIDVLRNAGFSVYRGAQYVWEPYFQLEEQVAQRILAKTPDTQRSFGSTAALQLKSTAPSYVRTLQRRRGLEHLAERIKHGNSGAFEVALLRTLQQDEEVKWRYSNFGYGLASHMAEMALEKPWEDIVTEQLFGLSGLCSAGIGEPVHGQGTRDDDGDGLREEENLGVFAAQRPSNNAVGHYANLSDSLFTPIPQERESVLPHTISAAGNYHMTVHDALRYLQFHLQETRKHTTTTTSSKSDGSSSSGSNGDSPSADFQGLEKSAFYYSPFTGPINAKSDTIYRNGWIIIPAAEVGSESKSTDSKHKKKQQRAKNGLTSTSNVLLMHDGSSGAWYAYCQINPIEGVAAIVMVNAATISVPQKAIAAVNELLLSATASCSFS